MGHLVVSNFQILLQQKTTSTDPSFQCPPNIAPYFNCNISWCIGGPDLTSYNCNEGAVPTKTPVKGPPARTPGVTSATGTKATAATTPTTGPTMVTGATKASGAFALKYSGNQLTKRGT